MEKRKYQLYEKNPNLKLVVVPTIMGNLEYKSNCVKLGNMYHTRGIHCRYDTNYDQWCSLFLNSINSPVFDFNTKKIIPLKFLTKGIIGFDDAGNEYYGYFSTDLKKNCTIRIGANILCMDYSIIPLEHYQLCVSTGVYFKKRNLDENQLRLLSTKRLIIDNSGNQYNILDNKIEFYKRVNEYNSSNFKIEKDIKFNSKFIGNYTFGAEIETVNGCLPEYVKHKYGVMICRDGSLRNNEGLYPPEYVTIPLSGSKGLQALRNVSQEISKCGDVTNNCSLHLHFGNFEVSRIFLVSLYSLCYKIQDQLFEMFPHYKTDEIRLAGKEKNYCQKLKDIIIPYNPHYDFNKFINSNYSKLYSFLAGGLQMDRSHNYKTKTNPWPRGKWNIRSRYYWVNFTNFAFGKQDTIEFRLHTGTTNSEKILNWLYICVAILQYAKYNTKKCLSNEPISVEDVFNIYGTIHKTKFSKILSKNIIEYYRTRRSKFERARKMNDFICNEEFINDAQPVQSVLNYL